MSSWETAARRAIGRGVDFDALAAHLQKNSHVRRPGARWRAGLAEWIEGPEMLAAMLSPVTAAGKVRIADTIEAAPVRGVVWATLDFPSRTLRDLLGEVAPWLARDLGSSHQVAYVAVQALGLWPDGSALRVLESFRGHPTMNALQQTVEAAIRRQRAAGNQSVSR